MMRTFAMFRVSRPTHQKRGRTFRASGDPASPRLQAGSTRASPLLELRFEYEVERRLRGTSKSLESAAVHDDVPEALLARLRAERGSMLRERVRDAKHRGGRIEDAADRVMVLLGPIGREGLDDHPCPVRRERLAEVARG